MIPSPEERFWSRVSKTDDCWLWTGRRDPLGYGRLSVKQRETLVHRFSFALHRGPIPPGLKCCHHCDTPHCVNPDHLYLGTDADNVADRERRGRSRHAIGVAHGLAKLDDDRVRAIRAKAAAGVAKKALAREYGVSDTVVLSIVARKTWRHV